MPYAYECELCHHLDTQHRLAPGAETVDGPYRCLQCDCEVMKKHRSIGLTREQFEDRQAIHTVSHDTEETDHG